MWAFGVEVNVPQAEKGSRTGLDVVVAPGEALPFRTDSFDGVISKVVIPYTDERKSVAELVRVAKKKGEVRVSYHGSGYYLRYLFVGPGLSRRIYACRTLLNIWVYAVFGRRLPGFVGDTLYQSKRRLNRYYQSLEVQCHTASSLTFLGSLVLIYQRLER